MKKLVYHWLLIGVLACLTYCGEPEVEISAGIVGLVYVAILLRGNNLLE